MTSPAVWYGDHVKVRKAAEGEVGWANRKPADRGYTNLTITRSVFDAGRGSHSDFLLAVSAETGRILAEHKLCNAIVPCNVAAS